MLESTRQVIADAPILATYEQAAADGWQVTPFQVDWTPAPGQTQAERDAELLEPGGYRTTTSYDALNRVTRHVLPADVEGQPSRAAPRRTTAPASSEQVWLDDAVYVAAHRLRRQGPAGADRLRQRRDDPLRLRPAHVPARAAAQRALHAATG